MLRWLAGLLLLLLLPLLLLAALFLGMLRTLPALEAREAAALSLPLDRDRGSDRGTRLLGAAALLLLLAARGDTLLDRLVAAAGGLGFGNGAATGAF